MQAVSSFCTKAKAESSPVGSEAPDFKISF